MEELFEQLQDNTRSFWQSTTGVRRLDSMPSPRDFFRDYVATSTPVIISGGASSCLKAPCGSWDDLSTLAKRSGAGDLEVTVDFTPDGKGDCVVDVPRSMLSSRSPAHGVGNSKGCGSNGVNAFAGVGGEEEEEEERDKEGRRGASASNGVDADGGSNGKVEASAVQAAVPETATLSTAATTTAVFVKPEERRIKFESFLSLLAARDGSGSPSNSGDSSGRREFGVPYLSHQNDSLRQEFAGLVEDVEPFLALARDAFGNEADAVNLWIGDDRSLSAVHKDHYENMYCVIRGEKFFTLLPPSDVLFLYEQEYPCGRYRQSKKGGSEDNGGGFEVELEEGAVPWIPVDPSCPDLERYPLFRHASPVKCRVGPGDILYLPALWYHRVSQKGITIAVNYWHDMQFDHKYVYYRFLQTLAANIQSGVLAPGGGSGTGAGVSVLGDGRAREGEEGKPAVR